MVYLLYKRERPRPFIYINTFVMLMSLIAGYCVNMVFCCMFESWIYLTIITHSKWPLFVPLYFLFSQLLERLQLLTV